jgi:hypothetical protein
MDYIVKQNINYNIFDKHVGSERTDLKKYDRVISYKGFDIKRNSNVPQGADGFWEVPDLKWFSKGGVQIGFLTVSITQAKEAIDKYLKFNF